MDKYVYLGRDNPIVLELDWNGDFGGYGLNNFTDVVVTIGSETYSLLIDPDAIVIGGANTLMISIGNATSLNAGRYDLSIVGISPAYPNGYVLACDGIELDKVWVVDCA